MNILNNEQIDASFQQWRTPHTYTHATRQKQGEAATTMDSFME